MNFLTTLCHRLFDLEHTSKSAMGHKVGASLLLLGAAVLAVVHAQGNQCYTPTRSIGTCINVKLCAPFISILTSPNRQQSDIQLLRDSQCGYDGSIPKVCCPASVPDRNTPQGQPSGNFGQASNFGQDGNSGQPMNNFGEGNSFGQGNNFGQQGNNFGQGDNSHLLPTECGSDLSNRIVGGNITEIHEFPWMALLEYSKPDGRTTSCGGVIINKRYVLTAAHCLKGKDLPRTWKLEWVRLGEYNTATERDCVPDGDEGQKCSDPPVTIRIEEQIVHEDYAPYSAHQRYDIALLRLSRDMPYTDYIRPICLPDNSNVASKLTAAGWGRTELRSGSDIKLKVALPLVDFRQCSRVYRNHQVNLGEGQFCAGGEKGFDSCRGDSGGPIMMREKEARPRWKVAGIVSFGPANCGMEGFPGVYTKVYDFLPWIMAKLRA
ncbi:CLIP domain-containing serine protease HP8-like [Phymastichus coffea]|uniref:CLIP domain-containing serine protease HP8-like n=1 Tax=Phymastichus coffea TaxID=108790 RepID=UPI00273C5834|nr:CLIP domain-containing serine protease HP8-like [Phymastichus coffea]